MSEPISDSVLDAAAAQFAAEEAPSQLKAARQAEAAAKLNTPPGEAAPSEPPAGGTVELSEAVQNLGAEGLANLGVVALNIFVPKFFGKKYELTEAEQQKLAAAAVPVVEKYLPDAQVSPEVAFLAVAAFIYGPKAMQPDVPENPPSPAAKPTPDVQPSEAKA